MARRLELFAQGFDPALQGLGSDPACSNLGPGLRVPSLATTATSKRYLFQVCTYKIAQGRCVRLVGVKQLLRIGLDTSNTSEVHVAMYPNVLTVRDPGWRFVDGNVSWHLRLVRNPPSNKNSYSILNASSFHKQWCDDSALVFETATFNAANLNGKGQPDNYTALTAYTAPFGGKPPGTPIAGLGTWRDVRYPYDGSWMQMLDSGVIQGPGAVVLYASVWQPSSTHTATITVPAMFPLTIANNSEEAFLAAWPKAQYWSVGGALAFEEVE